MLPEKITSKKEELNYEELKNELGDAYTTGVKRVAQVPKEKYKYPITTSQELGWDLRLVGYNDNFIYPRVQCNETKYADNYINMSHVSPFANQRKVKAKI